MPAGDRPSRRPWIMVQTWHDLLFAHWPLPAGALRTRLPTGLDLDRYDGRAWLGVVALRMDGVRLRGLPRLPFLSALAQVNVRTYVVADGRPGVFFFRLYASSRLAAVGARLLFSLPYQVADIAVRSVGDRVHYICRRRGRDGPDAALEVVYGPATAPSAPAADGLEAWLTERYRLFAAGPGGRLLRAEIAHPPWSLQPAEVAFEVNTLAVREGLALPPTVPLLHYARRMETHFWLPRRA